MSGKLKFLLTLLGMSAVILPVVLAVLSGNLRPKTKIVEVKISDKREKKEAAPEVKLATESIKLATPSVKPATGSGQ